MVKTKNGQKGKLDKNLKNILDKKVNIYIF
jgi:hypothetical protein